MDIKYIKLNKLVGILPPPFPNSIQTLRKKVREWDQNKKVVVYILKPEIENGNRYFVDIYSLNEYFEKEFGFSIISKLKEL